MSIETTALPDDVEQLQQLVIAQRVELEHLKLVIAKLRRMQFGRSSEKLDREITQRELQLEELEISQDQILAKARAARPEPAARKRQPLPQHLPREQRLYQPACSCPDCGGVMRQIGEDVSEMLEHVPEQFKVIRIVRPKLACERCERIVQEGAPSRPIARGVAGPGLLAHILVSKYCDHLPLYRQSQIYARQGVELERSTMAEWVGQVFQLVDPLIEALGRYVLGANKLHADDIPIPVLDPGRGKTKTGRLWTYVRDDRPAGSTDPPAVLFRYSPDRRGEHPQGHLKHFAGILQVQQRRERGLDYVVRIGSADGLGQHVLNPHHLHHLAHGPAGNHAGAFRCGFQQHLGRPKVPGDLVRNAGALQVELDQVLLGLLDALLDGHGHFASFAHAEPGMALLVAHHHERRKAEVLAAFDDLGDAVDGHDIVFQIRHADVEMPPDR